MSECGREQRQKEIQVGKLPAIIAKSDHLAAPVARAPNQATMVEPMRQFRALGGLIIPLRDILGPYFCWSTHLCGIVLTPCFGDPVDYSTTTPFLVI